MKIQQNTNIQTQIRSQSALPSSLSQPSNDPFTSPELNSSLDITAASAQPLSKEIDWSNAFDSYKTNDPFSASINNTFESPSDPFSNSKFNEDPWSNNPIKSTPSFDTAFGSIKKFDSSNKIGDAFGSDNSSSKTITQGFGNDDENWASINTASQNKADSSIAFFKFFKLSLFTK
jgi:hypothetical protein